jgi:hypothetical protein
MAPRKKRNKNEPTTGDKLHQDWRNRTAMFRVYEAARQQSRGIPGYYWTPFDIRQLGM